MASNRTKLSAAVLGLVLAGAPASVILDQFLNEKEGNSLTAYRDGGGVWTICRGATMVDGKPVVQGMKLPTEKCAQVNAIERDKALSGWTGISRCHSPNRRKPASLRSARTISAPVNVFPRRSTSTSIPVTVKVRVKRSGGGLKTAAVTAD